MPYNFIADSFHTKKLCSRLLSSEVRFYTENGPFCVFEPPRGLRGNVRCSSWAHCKARGEFLLVLIELFSLDIRLKPYERISVENRRFRSKGAG